MLIRNWMSVPVTTIGPEESMMKASKVMKDKNIRRLPVVDEDGRIIGIVSDRDIKEASPSKATTLDVHELYYLLSEIKVQDIMTKNPQCLKAEDSVEKAAVLLMEKHLGGLPIIDEDEKVVGIITETDIFKVLIEITRVRDGGVQMGFKMSRTPGELKNILEDIENAGAKALSVITVYPKGKPERLAYVRIDEMDKGDLNKLEEGLKSKFDLMFFFRDHLESLV
jgi:acetoin utilization protein AcuB